MVAFTREQQIAIKIEQLKNEKSKAVDPLKLELNFSIVPRIRAIEADMDRLDRERQKLHDKFVEINRQIKLHEDHYDLLIRATRT